MRTIEAALKQLERKARKRKGGDWCECVRPPIIHFSDDAVQVHIHFVHTPEENA